MQKEGMMKKKKKKKKRRASSGDVSVLPHELVFEVLTRLPAKSLMRFKCVSKRWCSTILDPCFAKAHRARSRSRPGLLITFPDGGGLFSESRFFYASLLPKSPLQLQQLRLPPSSFAAAAADEYFTVTEVVNGLACFYDYHHVSLWNLSNHEVMDLPTSDFLYNATTHYYFGFDPLNKEYKLLKLCSLATVSTDGRQSISYSSKSEILTLGTDSSWRSIGHAPYKFQCRSVCVNGTLYWVHQEGSRDNCFLIAFDLKDEKFRHIPKTIEDTPEGYHHLTQVGGCLAAAYVRDCKLVLLILEDHQGKSWSWTKNIIDLPINVRVLGCCYPVGTFPTGEMLFTSGVTMNPMPVFSYDPTTRKWERIVIGKFPPSPPFDGTTRTAVDICISYHEENVIPLKHLLASN